MIDIPFSEACERNKAIILETIRPVLERVDTVLEVGSGTAQHAIHFAGRIPQLCWQTSDQQSYLSGINSALDHAFANSAKLQESIVRPIELDVNQGVWFGDARKFDAVYTANTFHIMTRHDVERFFTGLEHVTHGESYLMVYGPFKYAGEFTSESNGDFDQVLRERGVGSGIRDFETIDALAKKQGFKLLKDTAMPANNQCLVWQRGDA